MMFTKLMTCTIFFIFVNVLFMAEKKLSNNVLFFSLNLGCVQRIGLQLVCV